MNKKEILEIRKQYTHEKCSISRICTCYVDGEKMHEGVPSFEAIESVLKAAIG